MKNIKIELTTKVYNLTSSKKSWSQKDVVTTKEVITWSEYQNYINSVQFFRNLGGSERLTKNYTQYGYIPVQLNSINPEHDIKIVRYFKFL